MSFSGHFEVRPGVRRLFRLAIRRRDALEDEADEEIRLHLRLRTQQLIDAGLSPAAARAEAERRFGSLDEARRDFHSSARRREDRMRTREWLDAARRDLQLAMRGLARAPLFTATAVITLALGVGVNAATFSLFDQLLLRPLPVLAPERLVNLTSPGPSTGREVWGQPGASESIFNYPMFLALAQERTAFAGLAAHKPLHANFAYEGRTEFGMGVLVSGSYFPVLGLKPALGRLLGPGDDGAPGANPVAVLSHGYWTSSLGADSSVVGRPIVVNGRTLMVVGVAPRGFQGTTLGIEPRLFVPLSMTPQLDYSFGPDFDMDDRQWLWLYLFGRLKPAVTPEQATAAMNALYKPVLVDLEAPLQNMNARNLERFKARTIVVEDGRRGQSLLHGQTRAPLLLLLAITGLVVLIAAANVANLLLARAATRSTEMAVRLSLGAGRGRLVRQMLTESLLLALLGGAASLLVAWATVGFVEGLIPPVAFGGGTRLAVELSPSALIFAGAVAMGTGVVFGLFPALNASRPDLVSSLKADSGRQSATRSAARFRTSLVTGQIALSMTLLVAAGLFIQSLRNLSRVELGIDVDRVVTFSITPAYNGYEPVRSRALFARIEEELAAVPGVAGVAGSSFAFLTGSTRGNPVRVEGFEGGPDVNSATRIALVGPGFFRTLGIPVLAGREFTSADRLGAPKVAVVNEAFVRKFRLGPNPLGRRMSDEFDAPLDFEIVGLVRNTRFSSVKGGEPPIAFFAYKQQEGTGGLHFYVRTSGARESVVRAVPQIVSRLDPNLPVVGPKTLADQARETVYLDRMIGMLSAAFAALATLLAAVGLYGVLAYTVAQRTREIGVRMALGASAWNVRGMVLGEVGRMVAVGAAVGVAAALAAGRVAESMLFGLSSSDPRVVAAATIVLGVVAVGAGYVPAWRASRVAPARALRGE